MRVTSDPHGDEVFTPHDKFPHLLNGRKPPSAAYLESLKACIGPIHQLLDGFLSLSPDDLDAIPSFHFVRVTYSMISLLYIHLSTSKPDSKIAKAQFDVRDLRVGEYIGRLIDMVPGSNDINNMQAAQKFHMVIKMFRAWFERQSERISRPRSRGPSQESQQFQVQPVEELNTPRLGYRQLSIPGQGHSEQSYGSEARSPISQRSGRTSSLAQRNGSTQMDSSGLALLSHVATNDSSATGPSTAGTSGANGETWQYNPTNAYQPNLGQLSYTDNQNYFNSSMNYTDPNFAVNGGFAYGNIGIDPAFFQTMGEVLGAEGTMCNTFLTEFFGAPTQNPPPFENF